MRRAAKIDANQQAVVDALRQVGATVHSLAAVGGGCPDLLVGFRGRTFLMEVKDGNKPPSERRLTPFQVLWHEQWTGGSLTVVNSPEDALKVIGVI
jgi:hypothetical protein